MKALKIFQPGQAEVVDLPLPDPADDEILIKIAACGICGTDVHIFRGEYLGEYPVIPGHEFSGEVIRCGAGITRYRPGDRVAIEPNIACNNCVNCLNNRQNFCLNWQAIGVSRPGGMAQYVLAPENAVFSIGELPFEQGAFVEPLSCVLHGIERARLRLADRIAILGAGPIGNLLLQVTRLQGVSHVTMVDRNVARAALAVETGADQVFTDVDELEKDGYDVVIDASGSISLMERSIGFARYGGTILLFGVPPAGKPMTVEAFQIFRKGLTIVSSFTSVRNSYQAVALLQSGQVDVSRLVSHRLPLEEFVRGVHMIENGLDNVKKVMLIP
jgi:2-desacetyl-2-hydroxyethyl bacteriochlorophyllide A dehydrogenase